MGSCKSLLISSKAVTQASSKVAYIGCKFYLVDTEDISFLQHLFKELCVRNSSKRLLEKSIFLLYIPIPGLLGERFFNSLDIDNDGYITEEQFLAITNKYYIADAEKISEELFHIADLTNSGALRQYDFMVTVIFTQFSSLIKEMLETFGKFSETTPMKFDTVLSAYGSLRISNYTSTVSTFGTATEGEFSGKESMEEIVSKIFKRFSSNGIHMSLPEFQNFCSSQQWIALRIKQCFHFQDWKSQSKMPLKASKLIKVSSPSSAASEASVKVFWHNKWMKRSLHLKGVFLYIFNEKREMDSVVFLEACLIKTKDCYLSIIYSTQYDDRYTFSFTSASECEAFATLLKSASGLRKFKTFYKINEKIGFGKFSEVFIVTEISTGKKWAAKKINKRMLDSSEREMIRIELSILNSFNHPGIVRIKETFDSHKSITIIMEYVKGGELLKKIRSSAANEAQIRKMIRSIIENIGHLHTMGVMHRDLKPENIMIADEAEGGGVKIIDFGLSCYYLPGEFKKFKCGTLGYTAPEVFTGKYDYKVDMWSIGIITFAYFTGRLPFFSYSKNELVELTQNEEVKFHEEEWAKHSTEAKDFISILLSKDPEERLDCQAALNHAWFHKEL